MSSIFAASLSCGFFCGLWIFLAGFTPLSAVLVGWIGFAGCTAYFGSGIQGKGGLKTAMISTVSGYIWATIAIFISAKLRIPGIGFIMAGLISFAMVYQSKYKNLHFVPGAFIGSFSTFAASETGINVLSKAGLSIFICLLLGACLGFTIDTVGIKLFEKFGR